MFHFKFATDNPAPDPRLCTAKDAERVGKTLLGLHGLRTDITCRRAAPHEIEAKADGDYIPYIYTFSINGEGGNPPRQLNIVAAEAIARYDAESTGFDWQADTRSGSLVRVEAKSHKKP